VPVPPFDREGIEKETLMFSDEKLVIELIWPGSMDFLDAARSFGSVKSRKKRLYIIFIMIVFIKHV